MHTLKIVETLLVEKLSSPVRLYDYLAQHTTILASRKATKKALGKTRVTLNGLPTKGAEFLKIGDQITVREEESIVKKIFPLTVNVLFEDEYLAIVEKPSGIPTSGNYYKTLLNALPFNLKKSTDKDALPTPLPIHRLDKLTSGLVVVAKTYTARILLGKMLENKEISKQYLAVVHGKINGFGLLNSPVEGKSALSSYRSLEHFETKRFGCATLIELSPITGRTHQLRIHLARLGFPIFGDKTYIMNKKTTMDKGLFLQAYLISFDHPILHSRIEFQIQQPNKFNWIKKN